jgi:two-component system response regulator (stage 0 sporulation protein F)
MAKIAHPADASTRIDRQTSGRRILLAEDTDEMREVIALRLRQQGYAVTECCNGAELIAELADYFGNLPADEQKRQFDLIISDIRMPGVFGLSVVEGGSEYRNFPPTILITAFGDDETHEKARQFGVTAVLDKPFDMNDLLEKVRDALPGAATA